MKDKQVFEWDEEKDKVNQHKHGVSFEFAKLAFLDNKRIFLENIGHSKDEQRFYYIGKVGEGILTVRFTYRKEIIRIIGAGYWRKGRKIYEKENSVH